MLDRTRRKYPDLRFVRADAATVWLEDEAERILCTYGLSMMDDWEEAVLNMWRHLTADGTLVILDFCPLGGILAPFDPLLRWWLGCFGVRADLDYPAVLEPYFQDVEILGRSWDYNILVRGRFPRSRAA
jgi:ubiquinone/menaquinone biosynthesis C-methylase UbiE